MAFPNDSPNHRTGERARACVHYYIDANCWEYREETGSDYGRDCILKLFENGEARNKRIEGQIKGSRSPKTLNNGFISFNMPIRTIEYALESPLPFVLFWSTYDPIANAFGAYQYRITLSRTFAHWIS